MSMLESRVWGRVLAVDTRGRGFDFEGCGLPHVALRPGAVWQGGVDEDNVRATFAAVGELASHWGAFASCDPDDPQARALCLQAADELLRMLAALRDELEDEQEER